MITIKINIKADVLTSIIDDLINAQKTSCISKITQSFLNRIIKKCLKQSRNILDEAEELYDVCSQFDNKCIISFLENDDNFDNKETE